VVERDASEEMIGGEAGRGAEQDDDAQAG
jgi:hypothetical protein